MNNKTTSLYSAKRGTFSVVATPDIGLLQNLGLRSGTRVTVQNRYGLGGPVLLRVEDTYTVAIGKDIARQISVSEVAAS